MIECIQRTGVRAGEKCQKVCWNGSKSKRVEQIWNPHLSGRSRLLFLNNEQTIYLHSLFEIDVEFLCCSQISQVEKVINLIASTCIGSVWSQDKISKKRKCTIEQKKEIKLISILEVNLSGFPLRTRCWDWPLSQLRSCETDQVNPKKCRLRLSLWPFHKINFSIYKQLKKKLIGTVWLLYATVFP